MQVVVHIANGEANGRLVGNLHMVKKEDEKFNEKWHQLGQYQ